MDPSTFSASNSEANVRARLALEVEDVTNVDLVSTAIDVNVSEITKKESLIYYLHCVQDVTATERDLYQACATSRRDNVRVNPASPVVVVTPVKQFTSISTAARAARIAAATPSAHPDRSAMSSRESVLVFPASQARAAIVVKAIIFS